MRKVLILLILWGVSAGLLAERQYYRFRSSGYYFRPPRTLYYLRPDLLHRPYFSYPYYGYYGYPAVPHYRHTPDWVGGPRGTYSTYIESPAGMEVVRANTSDLIFTVSPRYAKVYLDGKLIGSARDLAGERERYMVLDGIHELRVEYPGYKTFETELQVEPNRTVHLDIRLDPEPER